MKRTKESYFRQHPDWEKTENCSSCKEFIGEDLQSDARIKHNKQVQKQWLMEQMQENQLKKAQEKAEEQAYSTQIYELNRMRGMLEDQFQRKKLSLRIEQKEDNQQLAVEKKEKTDNKAATKLSYEQQEVATSTIRGQKQAFPPANN